MKKLSLDKPKVKKRKLSKNINVRKVNQKTRRVFNIGLEDILDKTIVHSIPKKLIPLNTALDYLKEGLEKHIPWEEEFSHRLEEKTYRYTKGDLNENIVYKTLSKVLLDHINWRSYKMGRKSLPDANEGIDILVIGPNGGLGIQVKSSIKGVKTFKDKKFSQEESILTICVNENTDEEKLKRTFEMLFTFHLKTILDMTEINP